MGFSCSLGRRGALPLWVVGLLLCLLSVAAAAAPSAEGGIPPEMEARVTAVFQRFVDVLGDTYPELREYTIEVVDERVANAWINASNQITVTTGLLRLLDTDDQLAGVIGHEIAHGLLGHIPYRVSQHLWSIVWVLAVGVISNTEGNADWGGLWYLRDMFLYAYSREQETEADLMGARLARRAGYDPRGLVEALERMDHQWRGLAASSELWRELHSTHPSMGQRASELAMMLATNTLDRQIFGGGLLGSGDVARSPEEAARRFAQALWSGDRQALEQMSFLLQGDQVEQWLGQWHHWLDACWAAAELEIAQRYEDGLDQVLVVRLWRPSPGGLEEESTPPVAVTLRRSARGWLVAGWELAG